MTAHRRTATIAGALYLVTHVTSVVALALYSPVLTNTASGSDTQLRLGAFLEVILTMAIVGTAVTLYPVVKRYNESGALGYVGLRTLEAAVIAVGVLPLFALVNLRHSSGADLLVALHNESFLVGPGFVVGVNTVLMAYLMYTSGLVPRFIPILGLVGGPLVFLSAGAQLFRLYPTVSATAALAAVPAFAWELCLAFYLILKGFREPAAA